MMLMRGRNVIELNVATINKIVTAWWNIHTIPDNSEPKTLSFKRFESNALVFDIEGEEVEN